jgi:hypothetical protein
MNDKIQMLDNGDFTNESHRELNKRLLEASNKLFFLKSRGPHSDYLTQKIIEKSQVQLTNFPEIKKAL